MSLEDKMEFVPKHRVVRVVDIDGVIFELRPSVLHKDVVPLSDSIETINKWFENGDYVCIWTSRAKCYEESTRKELDEVGLKYHELILGKPLGDIVEIYDDMKIVAHHLPRNHGLMSLGDLPDE